MANCKQMSSFYLISQIWPSDIKTSVINWDCFITSWNLLAVALTNQSYSPLIFYLNTDTDNDFSMSHSLSAKQEKKGEIFTECTQKLIHCSFLFMYKINMNRTAEVICFAGLIFTQYYTQYRCHFHFLLRSSYLQPLHLVSHLWKRYNLYYSSHLG